MTGKTDIRIEKLVRLDTAYATEVRLFLKELEVYTNEVLNQPGPDGGWSVLQVVHHLILSEEKSLLYVQKKLLLQDNFEKTGWRESYRFFMLRVFLQSNFKFKAPPLVGGLQDDLPAVSTLAEAADAWMKVRSDWHFLLLRMSPHIAECSVYKHPRVGRLGWIHVVRFFKIHFERHRKQIGASLSRFS